MRRTTLLLVSFLLTCVLVAQDYDYQFRLTLKDKGTTEYSLNKPEEFLSKKAIERREKQNIKIEKTDIPISEDYIKSIENTGGIIVAKSKWLNSVSVHCGDSSMVETLKALPFVADARFVWKGKKVTETPKSESDTMMHIMVIVPLPEDRIEPPVYRDYYGFAEKNIRIQNGQLLHEAGFKGGGIDIAVIDAGYNNLLRISLLDNINIQDSKGFVRGRENIFHNASQHGLNVLSAMATNKPHTFVGTAPEANYILLGSEDSRSEFPIEEDYWVTAIEYADSIGVDVVNTSLGYNHFDTPAKSFEHSDLDGKTALITRGADMAVRKGMFVVVSAGNSGNSEWRKITPPSDANLVLTVGAIQQDSIIAGFSSRGLTADLRTKPDVVALGSRTAVIGDNGYETLKNGTSFSSPVMCGLAACLWQAYPKLTNRQLLHVIREAGNKYESPDDTYGYGLPDMGKAMQLAKEMTKKKKK
ncbi:S8 family peptidase [Dysgonomonas sp. ZJ279]|uniref:S8 family peptidase n=1 Tax=Dysgonomonas sp. ZJ279 TaxID=2709796 RepID=UPI0013EAB5C8|nr:S8 family serine peptidase [Dysgonomonas sp. ZJ279]